jgi:isopenicillin-N epimerase
MPTTSIPTLPICAEKFMLRPGIAFLNHGSFGACPRPVFEVFQSWQRELEDQPVEFLSRRLRELLAEARAQLAAYVGAQPHDLVFVPNATYGVNIVARALDLQPGDEVLSTDHEYGAADRAWRFNCARRGAHYITARGAARTTSVCRSRWRSTDRRRSSTSCGPA